MNDKIIKKVYNFTGKITAKSVVRKYKTKEDTIRLQIEGNKSLQNIEVYQRKVSQDIWNQIVNDECLGKNYILYCEKLSIVYHLKDWKEIK